MKTIILSIVILVLIVTTSYAGEKWDKADKVLFGSFLVFDAIDYFQTKEICNNPKFEERWNPIIKKYGDKSVLPVFAIGAIGTYFIADWLKPDNRKIFLGIMSGLEINAAYHNYKVGIKFKLK